MLSFKQYLLTEKAYSGNIGAEEMIKFYEVANKKQQKEMDKIVSNEDWDSFKKLIKEVLGIDLK